MLCNTTAKIRILSDIFTIFASWTTKSALTIKRFIKIFWRIFVATASLLFAAALVIQLPQVQTFITEKVTDRISKQLDGEIIFEKIHLKPFTTLVIKNVAIIDKDPVNDPLNPLAERVDTFFRAEYIIARFTLEGLRDKDGLHIDKAFIGDGQMNLVLEDKEDEGDGDTSTDNLSRIFRLKAAEDTPKSDKELFHIRKVEINNMGFTMKSYQKNRPSYEDGGIDWNDMDISGININAKELIFKGGVMSGKAEGISMREKTGYRINQMSGIAKVGNGKTIVKDLRIKDPWSDVTLPMFMMSYENALAFQDFISKVKIDAHIAESHIDFKTVSFFSPELKDNRLEAEVSGKMSGYIDNFEFNDIKIKSSEDIFHGMASGRMTGLPYIETTKITAELKDFNISTKGLGNFVSEWMEEGDSLDISHFAPGMSFVVNAAGSGILDDFDIKANISSESGSAYADVKLTDLLNTKNPIGISGNVSSKDLDIGKVAGIKLLGPATLDAALDAKISTGEQQSELKIRSLKIARLNANDYDYSDITCIGKLSPDSFNGNIVCSDPNLKFLFQGTFALSSKTKNAKYQFFTNIGYADLYALNIDKRGHSKVLSFRGDADFTKASTGDLRGEIEVDDMILENSLGRYEIGAIKLLSHSRNDTYSVKLKSSFANGSYAGSASVSDFVKDLRDITLKKELPVIFEDPTYIWKDNSYKLDFRCSNAIDILTFIMPGLYIDAGTSISASLDENGRFLADIESNRLAYQTNYLRNIKAEFDNLNDEIKMNVSCDTVKVAAITMTDNHLNIQGKDNQIGLRFDYDNHSELDNYGEVLMNGRLSRDMNGLGLDLNIMPSAIFVNSKKWTINESSLSLKNKGLDVKSFTIASGDEQIRVEGKTSQERKDTLNLNLDRFDISILDDIIGEDIGIKGAVTGYAQITSPLDKKGILIKMLCDSTYLADVPMGELSVDIKNITNKEDQYTFLIRNDFEGKNNIRGLGLVRPKEKHLQTMVAYMDDLRIDYLQPFLTDIFSEMSGNISGSLDISGPFSNLDIKCRDTHLDDGLLKIAYTNVPYNISGPFHIDNTGVYFDGISIKDRFSGTGNISGSINWDHLKDIRFNTQVSVNDIEGINVSEDNNEGFYGQIFGTGNVNITGPLNSIVLDIDAITSKEGRIFIPLNTAVTAGKVTNLLRFKEIEKEVKIDPYEAMMKRIDESTKSASDFTVNLNINARPEVEVLVELDKSNGSIITGRGSGLIDISANADEFTINGDYTLNGGNCKYVAMGLVARDLEIEDGSSIHFNGDLMDSDLNLTAVYKTKASLSTLLAEKNATSNKRIVNCIIDITDKLSNPHIGLSIDVPDLNPMIKSRVESALSTEDKTQKQFLWLLVSGNFLPDEQSGIVNNNTSLYSNAATELLANQLNNIFEKLNIPLDLGLNYQMDESGNDLYDVAVSTQLWNNRLVVNGNIGNKQYSTSGSQNDVVGDIDIEYKLDKSGSFRLSMFSHSADQFSNYLDNTQRNGFGIMYQTEFSTFKQFFKSMNPFTPKIKRQEWKMQEEQAMLKGEKVVMKIEQSKETEIKKDDRK